MVIKKFNGSFFLVIGIVFIMIVSACSKEEDEVVPVDDPVIPTTDARDIIRGNWLCYEQEVGSSDVEVFEVVVSLQIGNEKGLVLSNFGNIGGTTTGLFYGDSITIAEQTVNGLTIEGVGYIASDEASNWKYSIIINNQEVNFLAGFHAKQ